MPAIGVDLAFDELKLVELVDAAAMVAHGDGASHGEGIRIHEAKGGGAVAEDEIVAVPSETPTFAVVLEFAEAVEGFAVVNESRATGPLQLEQSVIEQGKSFAEGIDRQMPQLEDAARFGIDPAKGGLVVAPGGLIIDSFVQEQSLGKGGDVVGIGRHKLITQAARLRDSRLA